MFFNRRDAEKHEQSVHLKKREFVCSYCDKTFGHRSTQLDHERIQHAPTITDPEIRPMSILLKSLHFIDPRGLSIADIELMNGFRVPLDAVPLSVINERVNQCRLAVDGQSEPARGTAAV